MAINCQNGGTRHSHLSVLEVRQCYSGVDLPPVVRVEAGGNVVPIAPWRSHPITEPQERKIERLLKARCLTWQDGHMMPTRKGPASDVISALVSGEPVDDAVLNSLHLVRAVRYGASAGAGSGLEDGPLREVPVVADVAAVRPAGGGRLRMPKVPEGRYAISSATGANDLDFFRVRETRSRPGFLYLYRVIGGRSDQRLAFPAAVAAAERIAALGEEGQVRAMGLYGRELGYCGRCGRHLTDELSRQIGIGPVCRNA